MDSQLQAIGVAGFGQQCACLVQIYVVALHVRVVERAVRVDATQQLPGHALMQGVDHVVPVDGVGDCLPHLKVTHDVVGHVELQVVQRTDTSRVRDGDHVRVVENLLFVEDTGVPRRVVFAALQAQQCRVLVGDDDVDDAVEVGTTGDEEVLIGLEHDLLRGVPLFEDERARPDGDQIALQGGRVVRVARHLVDRCAVIHDVLGHYRHQHVRHGDPQRRVWIGQVEHHREVIGRIDRTKCSPHPGEGVVVLDYLD